MLGKWFHTKAPKGVKHIETIFLIIGHSFILSGRATSINEKKIMEIGMSIQPEEYTDALQSVSITNKLHGILFSESASKSSSPQERVTTS